MTEKIQLRKNNEVPAIATTDALVAIRLDEKRYPRYKNIPQAARLEWMATEIKTLSEILRVKDFDGRVAIMTAAALDKMVMQEFYMSDLTLPEIHDAYENGIFGLYGEFYGINAPSLYGFLDGYIHSDKKIEAAKKVIKTKEEIRAEKSRLEREAEQRKIRAEIEEATRNGTFVPTGKAWFKPEKVDDVIAKDAEHREKVRRQAEEIMRQLKNQ